MEISLVVNESRGLVVLWLQVNHCIPMCVHVHMHMFERERTYTHTHTHLTAATAKHSR